MIPMQANISGYGGRAATVFAALDEEAGILVIAATTDEQPRREGCLLIATDTRQERDALFQFSDLLAAITAYHTLLGGKAEDGISAALTFSEKARRADPGSAIEVDGIDVSGPIYRVAPEASNAQIGTLALCLQARKHAVSEDVVEMADVLKNVLHGRAVTI